MRIIPELEKNSRIVDVAQSLFGQLLITCLYVLGLSLVQPTVSLWVSFRVFAILALIQIFPKHRKWVLLIAAIYYAFLVSPLDYQLIQRTVLFSVNDLSLHDFILRSAAILLTLLMCSFILMSNIWKSLYRKLSVLSIFLFYDLMILFSEPYKVGLDYSRFIWTFLLVFGNYYLFVAHFLHDQFHHHRPFRLLDFIHVRPFWNIIFRFPLQERPYLMDLGEIKKSQDFAVMQLKGIKLIYWSVILKYTSDFLHYIIYGKFEWIPLQLSLPSLEIEKEKLSLFFVNMTIVKTWQYWIFIVASFGLFHMKITYIGNTVVSLGRMCGYSLNRIAHRPFQSKSFADFFRRVHYYYYVLIRDLFFYPLVYKIKLRSYRLQIFLATFISIFIGAGIQIHLFSHPSIFFGYNLKESIIRWIPAGIHHLIFATLISTSVMLELKNRGDDPKNKLINAFMFIVYVWSYAWTITYGFGWPKSNFREHFMGAMRLLGLA